MPEKTAKDMPPGSQVVWRSITFTKAENGRWATDRTTEVDAFIDNLLTDGAVITFIPAGQGQWQAHAERHVHHTEETPK